MEFSRTDPFLENTCFQLKKNKKSEPALRSNSNRLQASTQQLREIREWNRAEWSNWSKSTDSAWLWLCRSTETNCTLSSAIFRQKPHQDRLKPSRNPPWFATRFRTEISKLIISIKIKNILNFLPQCCSECTECPPISDQNTIWGRCRMFGDRRETIWIACSRKFENSKQSCPKRLRCFEPVNCQFLKEKIHFRFHDFHLIVISYLRNWIPTFTFGFRASSFEKDSRFSGVRGGRQIESLNFNKIPIEQQLIK